MHDYRPITQTVKERIELILTEEVNQVSPEQIDLFIVKTTNKLMELFIDELNYNANRFR